MHCSVLALQDHTAFPKSVARHSVARLSNSFHFTHVHNRRPELELATVMTPRPALFLVALAIWHWGSLLHNCNTFFSPLFSVPCTPLRALRRPLWLLLSAPCISNSKQICRLGAPGATFYERARDALPQIWLWKRLLLVLLQLLQFREH